MWLMKYLLLKYANNLSAHDRCLIVKTIAIAARPTTTQIVIIIVKKRNQKKNRSCKFKKQNV